MLLQFTVQNFLSFDEEQTFSMLASESLGDKHPSHLIKASESSPTLVRAAALYGANASGKSNLVQAIRFAANLVTEGTRGTQAIPVKPFKLRREAAQEPSRFGFIVQYENVTYNYGFAVTRDYVQEEWLFLTGPAGEEERLFERISTEDGTVEVEFGEILTHDDNDNSLFWRFIAKGTRPNQLLLAEAFERNQASHLPILRWFMQKLTIIGAEAIYSQFERLISLEDTVAVNQFLTRAGTGISKLQTRKMPLDSSTLDEISGNLGRQTIDEIMDAIGDDIIDISLPGKQGISLVRDKDGTISRVVLRLEHQGGDGYTATFEMNEESDGTRRIIHLLPVQRILRSPGSTVIIDEIDRRLHPQLSRLFIESLLECPEGEEPPTSQIIFTTHETHLLDVDILRQDEIWFVEKDGEGASHLYSLAEYPIPPELQIGKGYLNGRFGAVPFAGDPTRLCLSETAVSANR